MPIAAKIQVPGRLEIQLKMANLHSVNKTVSVVASKLAVSALLLLLPLCLGVTTSRAQGQSSNIKLLNPPGAAYAFAFGLNSRGVVVGSYTDARGVYRGFAYSGGTYKTIVFPGATTFTQANGVNDSNTVVGDFIGVDRLTHGFLLTGNKFIRYDAQNGVSNWISGINNAGNLVGYVGNQGDNSGFVKIGREVTLFRFQGNVTYAQGINASNTVVGFFIPPPFIASHGFYRFANGRIIQLDYPGSITTDCLGINDAGEITGFYLDTRNGVHGFTYKNGRFQTSTLPDIAGSNNLGIYVGSYTAPNGKNYGYGSCCLGR